MRMKFKALLPLLGAARSMVKESVLGEVGLSRHLATLSNGIKQENAWILRNGSSGSVVNFKSKNLNDEWSLEVSFDEPQLKHPEFAGIYVWYTDDPIREGNFKGGNGQFNGIVAGMEFVGKAADLIVSVNHGDVDYTGLPTEETSLVDSPDPAHFKDHKTLKLKIISTEKNFKIEVYGDGNKLLYDRVRFTSMKEVGTRLSGKYFGISTDYHKVHGTRAIRLTGVQLNAREETDEYDVEKIHSELPDVAPRAPAHITHPEEEMQHVISGIEHLAKYLRVTLGDPQMKPLAESITYMKKTLNFQSAHILEVRDALKSLAELSKAHAEREAAHREDMLSLLRSIQGVVHDLSAQHEERPHSHRYPLIGFIFFCAVSCALGYFLAVRQGSPRKLSIH